MAASWWMPLFALLLLGAQGFRVSEVASKVLGYGKDVCQPEKGWLYNGDKWDEKYIIKRIIYKQKRAFKQSEWIARKHCIFTLSGLWFPRVCLVQWFKLAMRMRQFASCAKIPINDGSKLSAMIWGTGPNNMQDFMQKILSDVGEGFNGNKYVNDWLDAGNCTFRFDTVKATIVEQSPTLLAEGSQATDAVADIIVDKVFGAGCHHEKVMGLATFRKRFRKSIVSTINELLEGDASATIERVQALAEETTEAPAGLEEFVEEAGVKGGKGPSTGGFRWKGKDKGYLVFQLIISLIIIIAMPSVLIIILYVLVPLLTVAFHVRKN